MENWISDMYKAAIAKHKEYGLKDGMAIFYSPVMYKPKILFIGDNPGSGSGTIHKAPPKISEYAQEYYLLAKMMRRIFSTPELTNILTKGVITNRVFFQSENISSFKKLGIWNDMQKWCFTHIETIIEKIEPEIIFAESIGTYEALIKGLKGEFGEILVPDGGRGLLRSGKIGDKLILGIKHPTGIQRVSYDKWGLVTQKLSDIIVR